MQISVRGTARSPDDQIAAPPYVRGMEASHPHIRHVLPSLLTPRPNVDEQRWTLQLRWFAAAAVVGFAVPFVGSSLLGLQHDVYLGVYFLAVLALCTAYTVGTGLDLRETFTRHWKLGVALGL